MFNLLEHKAVTDNACFNESNKLCLMISYKSLGEWLYWYLMHWFCVNKYFKNNMIEVQFNHGAVHDLTPLVLINDLMNWFTKQRHQW